MRNRIKNMIIEIRDSGLGENKSHYISIKKSDLSEGVSVIISERAYKMLLKYIVQKER